MRSASIWQYRISGCLNPSGMIRFSAEFMQTSRWRFTLKINPGFFTATLLSLLMASSHAAAEIDSLFSYVPEDTIYFYANSKPLPTDFYDEQVRQAEQVLAIAIHQTETRQKAAADKQAKASAAKGAAVDLGSSPAEKFIKELMLEVLQNAESDKLANIGLSRDSRSIIYGIGLTPVMRVEIVTPDAVMAMLKRVEQRAGFKLNFQSCDGLNCLVVADDKGELGVALVIHNDHMAASLFQNANRDKVLQHLTGKNKPEKSYTAAQFRKLVESNGYSGYGEGFFNLQQGVENLQNVVTAGLKQKGESDLDQVQKCFQVAKAVVTHTPEIVMGVKSIQGRTINLEAVLKTTPKVSKALMAIPASLNTFEVSANPMVEFGFSANVPKLRDSLLSFMAYLGDAGEKAGCQAIQKKAMDEASMGIAMAMGFGLAQVKTLYVAIDDVKLGKNSQPEKASARFSLIADDPMGMVRMLSMFAPPLATLQVPDDGTSVPLPDGLLPPGMPPVSLTLKEKNLNIIMGDGKAAVRAMDTSNPALFWLTTDGPRYYSVFAQLMESAPPAEEMSPEEQQQAIEMMRLMGRYQPWMSLMAYPDERGIVVNISARYP